MKDKKALILLNEIFDNLTDDDLIDKNSEELETAFGKTSGTINDFVFYSDLKSKEILRELKKDTVIKL